jgi:hypothetical protein
MDTRLCCFSVVLASSHFFSRFWSSEPSLAILPVLGGWTVGYAYYRYIKTVHLLWLGLITFFLNMILSNILVAGRLKRGMREFEKRLATNQSDGEFKRGSAPLLKGDGDQGDRDSG